SSFPRCRYCQSAGSPTFRIRAATCSELFHQIRTQNNRKQNNMITKNQLAEAVAVERTFDAPIERVWKALTDVDAMRQWYFDLKEFKAEVGFEFEFIVEHEGMK